MLKAQGPMCSMDVQRALETQVRGNMLLGGRDRVKFEGSWELGAFTCRKHPGEVLKKV